MATPNYLDKLRSITVPRGTFQRVSPPGLNAQKGYPKREATVPDLEDSGKRSKSRDGLSFTDARLDLLFRTPAKNGDVNMPPRTQHNDCDRDAGTRCIGEVAEARCLGAFDATEGEIKVADRAKFIHLANEPEVGDDAAQENAEETAAVREGGPEDNLGNVETRRENGIPRKHERESSECGEQSDLDVDLIAVTQHPDVQRSEIRSNIRCQ